MKSTHPFRYGTLAMLGFVMILATAVGAVDAPRSQIQKIIAGTRAQNDAFGARGAIAVSGDYALIGAPGAGAGAAYIFKRDPATGHWAEQQKIVASDGAEGDSFGYYLELEGECAVVGTWIGNVYTFTRDSGTGVWIERQKIVGVTGDLALHGNRLMAPGIQSTQVFERAGISGPWVLQQTIPVRASTVSFSGDYAIVGWASTAYGGPVGMGEATILKRNSATGLWVQHQKIAPSDARDWWQNFGVSVAMQGDCAIVGSIRDSRGERGDELVYAAGAAYVFVRDPVTDRWNQQQKIVADDRLCYDMFGQSLALSGDRLLVSAFGTVPDEENNTSPRVGTVYEFERDPTTNLWTQRQKLLPPDGERFGGQGANSDRFGRGLALAGDTVLIGSASATDADGGDRVAGAGAVYVFSDRTSNHPPTIDRAWADHTRVTFPAGTTVHVDATDADGDTLTYAWSSASFTTGYERATFAAPKAADSGVTFDREGAYLLLVTVTDGHGGVATCEVPVAELPASSAILTSVEHLSVAEGGSAVFQVKLASQPAANTQVFVACKMSKQGRIRVNGLEGVDLSTELPYSSKAWVKLSFTPTNWNTWQNVTVTALADDNLVNGSAVLQYCLGYSGEWGIVTVSEIDRGTPPLENRIVTSVPSVIGPEGGTVSFQVKLAAPPATSATVTVARTAGDADISIGSGSSRTFTSATWNIWQPVTLAMAQDADIARGTATITCSASGWTSAAVTATENDNDAMMTVSATAGGTTIPSGAVALETGAPNSIQAIASPGYYFENWTYTVAQVADLYASSTTVIPLVAPGSIAPTVTANFRACTPGTIVASRAYTRREGSTGEGFRVWLGEQPAGAVTVTVARTAGDTDLTVVGGSSLTFTPANWSVGQVVTLAAAEDADSTYGVATFTCSAPGWTSATVQVTESDNDPPPQNRSVTITASAGGTTTPTGTTTFVTYVPTAIHAAASPGYVFVDWTSTYIDLLGITDVRAADTTMAIHNISSSLVPILRANFRPESQKILTNIANLSVPEGGTAAFQVKLGYQPTANLTVAVARAGDVSVTVAPSLTFTPTNWNTYQTVTLTAAEDADVINGTATLTCSATDWFSATVTATEADNDTTLNVVAGAGGTVVPSGAMVTSAGVATAISATPATGFTFVNWTVTSGTASFANTTAATSTVTITAPATVQANFVSSSPGNTAPTISNIADLTTAEDVATAAIAFTVGDVETAASALTLTANSSNLTLVPLANIAFGGSGASRTITVTPAANRFGTATITVTVSDGALTASDTFVLTVTSVNDVPTITSAASATPNPVTLPATATVSVVAADADGDALSYAWTRVSGSGTATFSAATAASGHVVFGAAGTYVLRVTIADGHGGSATGEVTVTVNPVVVTPPVAYEPGGGGGGGCGAGNLLGVLLSSLALGFRLRRRRSAEST